MITAELPQATLTWASPIQVATENPGQRSITELLHSSDEAWLSESLEMVPRVTAQGMSSFTPEGERSARLLGVISQERFDSYFAGKTSPLLESEQEVEDAVVESTEVSDSETADGETVNSEADTTLQIGSVIERSPESARIILFSSNDFLRDQLIRPTGRGQQTEYLNTLQLVANAVDWSLQDVGLLSIRCCGHFNRTLPPMERSSQLFWEYLNYGLAVTAQVIIAVFEQRRRRGRQRRYFEQFAQ